MTAKSALRLWLPLVVLGCNATGTVPDENFRPVPAAPPFRPLLVMPLPDLGSETPRGTPLANLSGRDTPVRDVLLALFKDSSINLLVDPTVTGNATFDIKATTVERAFEALLRTLDLSYDWDGEFLHVSNRQREIFDVDLVAATAQTSGSSGGGSSSSSSSSASAGASNGASESIWTTLSNDLRALIGDNGSLLINQIAGTVQVEATPSSVERVHQYLDRALGRARRQVSLEARILEIRLNDEYRLGVNWTILPGFLNTGETGTLPGGAAIAQTAASGGTALNFGMLKANNFSAFLDALETQGQVRVLSSPRVSTMNNLPATIRVVDQIPVIDREIIDSQGGLRTEFNIRFVEAGVTIAVTPQVGEDGIITVVAQPRITEQTGTVITPDGLQSEPILSTRETTATVRVPDGQALVIGGLRSTRKSETLSGVPLLMSIPWLGNLFRSTVQQREEVELMVLIAPRVLDANWIAEERRRGTDRLLYLRRPFQQSSISLQENSPENWTNGLLSGEPTAGDRPDARMVQPAPRISATAASLTVTREGLADRMLEHATKEVAEGETGHAIDLLLRCHSLDPRREAPLVIAAALEAKRNNVDTARGLFDRALRVKPDSLLALHAKGTFEVTHGRGESAYEMLKQVHDKAPGPESANNLAAAMIVTGRLADARTLLETWGARADAVPETFANLAFVLHQFGEHALAKAALQKALLLGVDPRDPRAMTLQQILAN